MSIEHSDTPSVEFRFFVYCPNNAEFTYCRTAEARDRIADSVIQGYLDDGWDEMVEQVVAGEMTHYCAQVGREDRPEATELDAVGFDKDGKYWGEWAYTCNYDLLPLVSGAAVAAQGIPGTSFAALNAKANAGDL